MTFKIKAKKPPRPKPLVPKALGVSRVDKGPLRDRAHMARVAQMLCIVCSDPYVQVHHIRECYPRTMGKRVGDDKVLPVCVLHHAEIHHTNTDALWRRAGVDAKAVAARLYAETLKERSKP